MDSKRLIARVIGILGIFAAFSSRAALAAPPIDPCSLLTPAQVSAVLGVEVGAGKRVVPTLCEWSVTGQSGYNTKKLIVTIQDPKMFVYAKTQIGHGVTKTPVSGVGDEAVAGTTPHFAAILTVKKGDVVFVVHIFGFPLDPSTALDEVQAKEKTLALEILSKL